MKEVESDSWDGITIGLAESIITIARVLNKRMKLEARRMRRRSDLQIVEWEWFSQEVQDAMTDLRHNDALRDLFYPGDRMAMDIITSAAALLLPKLDQSQENVS